MKKVYVLMCGGKLIAAYANNFDAWNARDFADEHCNNDENPGEHNVVEVKYYV